MILTASRKPDSVGELSMRASNTSSEFVLTYRRTNINQEKTFFSTNEDTSFNFDLTSIFYETCMFLSTSLCIFFASLFVGWGARLVSVWIPPLQRTPGSANICIRQKRPLSFCLKMLTVMAKCYVFLCVCVCVTMLTFLLRPWEWPIETGKQRGDQRSD